MNMSGLARARRNLETNGRFPGGAIPADISESWLRSLEHGIDPVGSLEIDVIPEDSLRQLQQRHQDLIRFARPELELLFDQISGSNFMIALGSPEGIVINTLADSQFRDSRAGKVVIPGSVWTEERRGTNAVGLTLKTLRPAQVYGEEHFLRDHGNVSCISAPIFDGRGNLAGILDASTSVLARQQHTSALVQMSASNIENAFIRSSYSEHLVLVFHPRPEFLSTLSVGMLVLTEDFHIHAVNRRGQLFLSGQGDLIEKHFEELFDTRFDKLMPELVQGETIRVRDRLGSGVSMRCVANRASFRLANRNPASHARNRKAEHGASRISPWVRHLALNDSVWRQHLAALPDVMRENVNILVTGASGSGKEVFARLAHAASKSEGPFVSVDCATIDPSTFADRFFAREPVGAGQRSILDTVSRGTLMLDNVEKLDKKIQSFLERFLSTRERPIRYGQGFAADDIRIIGISRQSVHELRKVGTELTPGFLERLAGVAFALPRLSERTDYSECVRATLRQIEEDAIISDDAIEWLQDTSRPESFIALSNMFRSILSGKAAKMITIADFPDALLRDAASTDICQKCSGSSVKAHKCKMIRARVRHFNGNVSQAARDLGVSRTTVYSHL